MACWSPTAHSVWIWMGIVSNYCLRVTSCVLSPIKRHCSLNILRAATGMLVKPKICQAHCRPMEDLLADFGFDQSSRAREIPNSSASAGGVRGEGTRQKTRPSSSPASTRSHAQTPSEMTSFRLRLGAQARGLWPFTEHSRDNF